MAGRPSGSASNSHSQGGPKETPVTPFDQHDGICHNLKWQDGGGEHKTQNFRHQGIIAPGCERNSIIGHGVYTNAESPAWHKVKHRSKEAAVLNAARSILTGNCKQEGLKLSIRFLNRFGTLEAAKLLLRAQNVSNARSGIFPPETCNV